MEGQKEDVYGWPAIISTDKILWHIKTKTPNIHHLNDSAKRHTLRI